MKIRLQTLFEKKETICYGAAPARGAPPNAYYY